MEAIPESVHILDSHKNWIFLWNWLEDQEVYFGEVPGNNETTSQVKMVKCFSLLHERHGMVFWRLHPNITAADMDDKLEKFPALKDDEVGVFEVHTLNGQFLRTLKQYTVSLSWWKEHKDESNLRQLILNHLGVADNSYMKESYHVSKTHDTWVPLWEWLGDREVFFCAEPDDILSSSPKKMLECFTILHEVHGLVFWQLHPNAIELGMHDTLGQFIDAIMDDDEVGFFQTHTDDGEEHDYLEQSAVLPISWWYENKDSPDIRQLCAAYLESRRVTKSTQSLTTYLESH